MILAYLTAIYARSSDTFVRAEVIGLRARGHVVHTFSLRRPPEGQTVSDEIRREQESTTYLVPERRWEIVRAALAQLVLAPGRALRALGLAWRTARPGTRGHLLALAYWAEAAYLARRMRALGVEHLHDHIGEASASVAMLAGEHSGIPFSFTVHGPYVFRDPEGWALGPKIARAAFVACITHFTRSQCMIQAPPELWERLVLVRCAPDRRFLAEDPPPLPAAPSFVWIGRVCEEKGVPVLVEAAERLAAEGARFELTLVGDGPLRVALARRVAASGISDRVRFTGWASTEAVKHALGEARVLVMPSFAEGLPVVLMEALALGRPVIATYVAGIPELVEEGADGWMVPAGSVDLLVGAMRAALSADDATLERLGAEGRRRIVERHDPDKELSALERHFAASATRGA